MNSRKILHLIVILAFVVSSAPVGRTYASQAGVSTNASPHATDQAVPAPTNGPKPTIHLSVNHGYVGQSVTVSGNVPSASYTGVRVSWVISDTTYTAAVVNRDANLAYQATTGVPHTLDTGVAKVCAALTGIAIAEFACQDFTIDAAPNGSVTGSIPLTILATGLSGRAARPDAPLSASANLLDRGGNILYSGSISGNGSFSIPNVTPGIYQVAVTGSVSQPVMGAPVIVNPGISAEVSLTSAITMLLDPVTGQPCSGNFSAQVSAVHNTATSNNFLYQVQYLPYFYNLSNIWNTTPRDYDFGLYITGVSLQVPFSSYLQVSGGASVSEVQYHVKLPNGTIVPVGSSSNAGSNYGISYDVGNLPAGNTMLIVAPVVSGVRQCPSQYKIRVMPDPMKDPILQPGASTSWDSNNNRYKFQGTLVNVGGLLPLIFPDPPPSLPLIGNLTNEFSAGVNISGNITLDGVIHIQVMQAQALATLFSINIFNNKVDLLKAGENTTNIDPSKPLNTNIAFGPTTLWKDSIDTPVFKGVIASFWGIVSINASISVGLGGSLTIEGTIYPFQPNLDTTLVTQVTPSLTISIWVDILLGVASAGADATASIGFGLPLRVATNDPSHPEMVWLDTPCFSVSVTLSAWARVNLLFWSQKWNIGSFTLVNYSDPSGCNTLAQAIKAIEPEAIIAPPRIMASPAVATSPAGDALSVYIVDTTPDQQQPTPRVAASFWDTGSQMWQAPMYLTAGNHAVQDPVAAFVGPASTPVVAWTETNLTLAQEQNLGEDINAYMQQQEIFFTSWNGSAWKTPTRLTNNALPDGRASIAGNMTGGTLAWVENTGGLTSTPQKMRIAVTEWDPASETWDVMTLMNGNPLGGDAMNVQPSTARFDLPGQPPQRAVAWTVDMDGDPSTNSDRQLVVARWNSVGGWSSPIFDLTGQLPAGGESPSLSFDPQTGLAHMAFLLRRLDGDGTTHTGVGNRSILYSADANQDTFWTGAPVEDHGQTIFAEKPVLQISNNSERLLLFRRFGAPGTNAILGQLALSQGLVAGGYSAPLYMTDGPINHWQQSFAINPMSGDAMVLNVNRSTISTVQTTELNHATDTPVSTKRVLSLTAGNDTVESLNVPSGPDLALDPSLAISAQHASLGEAVVVSATLRNLGRGPASSDAIPISVCFYSGVPPTGTQLGCDDLPGGTTFSYNTSMTLSFDIVANGAEQPIYAQVFSNGYNGNPTNDVATGALGAIPAPILTSVGQDKLYLVNALGIRWIPPLVSGVLGYRVLRSVTPGGPYELVGETSASYLPDLLLERGVNYCYVVQAFDSAGTLSPYSNQICSGLQLLPVLLPIIEK